MMRQLLIALLLSGMISIPAAADERDADDFLRDGELELPFKLVHTQSGEGIPWVITTIEVDDDNYWEAEVDVGGRKKKHKGRLTKEQARVLAAALAEGDIWVLPRENAAPIKAFEYPHWTPPLTTSITLTYGETDLDDRIHHTVAARVDEDVKDDESNYHAVQVIHRVQEIEIAARRVTLDAEAVDVAMQFIHAWEKENLDEIERLSATPFWIEYKTMLKMENDVRNWFKQTFADHDHDGYRTEFQRTFTWRDYKTFWTADFPDSSEEDIRRDKQKIADGDTVMEDESLIVIIQMQAPPYES